MTATSTAIPGASEHERDLQAASYDRPGAGLPRPSLARALTWSEIVHGLANVVLAVPVFITVVVLLSVGAGLTVLYVGLVVLVAGLLIARAAGHVHRALGYALLGTYVRPPDRLRPTGRSPIAAGSAVLRDGANWRAVAFHLVDIVLAPVQFAFTLGFLAYGLGAVTYATWRPYLPQQTAADGSTHRGWEFRPDVYVDTVPRMVVLAAVGVVVLLLLPYVVRFFTSIHRSLMRLLLGPTAF